MSMKLSNTNSQASIHISVSFVIKLFFNSRISAKIYEDILKSVRTGHMQHCWNKQTLSSHSSVNTASRDHKPWALPSVTTASDAFQNSTRTAGLTCAAQTMPKRCWEHSSVPAHSLQQHSMQTLVVRQSRQPESGRLLLFLGMTFQTVSWGYISIWSRAANVTKSG